jgi:hypothetical protein
MGQNHDTIGREAQIRLYSVSASLHGAFEGTHGVLRPRGLVAAMSNVLRQKAGSISLGRNGGCPGRFARGLAVDRHEARLVL